MRKLTGLDSVSAAMLAAEVALPEQADLLSARPGQLSRVLVLDGIQDPGNLGTLLRTALALGWEAVVLVNGCCDPFNDKALKASRGAVFRLPLAQYTQEQWEELVERQGLLALAAEPDRAAGSRSGGRATRQQQPQQQQQLLQAAGSLQEVQQRMSQLRLCLCLGAEGQGVSPDVMQRCQSVSIAQFGEMESLNASAAGSILMFALSAGASPLFAELAALPGGQ